MPWPAAPTSTCGRCATSTAPTIPRGASRWARDHLLHPRSRVAPAAGPGILVNDSTTACLGARADAKIHASYLHAAGTRIVLVAAHPGRELPGSGAGSDAPRDAA